MFPKGRCSPILPNLSLMNTTEILNRAKMQTANFQMHFC